MAVQAEHLRTHMFGRISNRKVKCKFCAPKIWALFHKLRAQHNTEKHCCNFSEQNQPENIMLLRPCKPMKTIKPNIEERAFSAMRFLSIRIKNNVGDNFRITRGNTIKN